VDTFEYDHHNNTRQCFESGGLGMCIEHVHGTMALEMEGHRLNFETNSDWTDINRIESRKMEQITGEYVSKCAAVDEGTICIEERCTENKESLCEYNVVVSRIST